MSGRRRLKWKKAVILAVVVLAALLSLSWGAYALLKDLLVVPEVVVPNLHKLSIEEAERELSELGLNFTIVGEVHDDNILPDHIFSQEPPAGRSVRKERVIELVVSLGPDYAVVPNLVGRSELEARLILTDAGLEMETSSEYNEEVPPGYVVRQDPSESFKLAKGEMVHVVLSSGKKPFSLRNFQNWTLQDAQEWLNLYGLVLRNLDEEYSLDIPEGHVISQFPSAGEMLQAGDPVDLVISKGREPGTYETYSIQIHPQVAIGQVIKVYVEDEEGTHVIFEGIYQGQVIEAKGVGSGHVVLMELRDNEYYTVDTRQFP